MTHKLHYPASIMGHLLYGTFKPFCTICGACLAGTPASSKDCQKADLIAGYFFESIDVVGSWCISV